MLDAGSIRYQAKAMRHGDPDTLTCPHCWTVFPLEDALHIARHPDLVGDPILNDDYVPSRFKATVFNDQGQAVDPGGYPCLEIACPNCHLQVPRSMADLRSVFLSIVGATSSGKSVFLGSAIWQLRRTLDDSFALDFSDLETGLNEVLHGYEETLFFSKDKTAYVKIAATMPQGELYDRVSFDNKEVLLPKPFIFTIIPQPTHPAFKTPKSLSRNIILYDNSGEHFKPGNDTSSAPGTMHMAKSECIFLVFDPTLDPRFRAQLPDNPDPQCRPDFRIERQDVIFSEAARRIRRHLGLPTDKKSSKRVIVIANKFDIWKHLIKIEPNPEPFVAEPNFPLKILDVGHIRDVSFSVRFLMHEMCPEVVAAIEALSDKVIYIPTSPLGCSPRLNLENGDLQVRPADIKPFWVTIPFLYAFTRLGLLYRARIEPPVGVAPAKLMKRFTGLLLCGLADGTTIEVPETCAGYLLHHPQSGIPFVVPSI